MKFTLEKFTPQAIAGWGRVYQIMGLRQLLLVKPAPT